MSTRPDPSHLRDLVVLAAFWVAAVLLLREFAPASPKGTAFAQTVAIGFVIALGCFAIAAVGLRTQFPRMWRLARLAYGVLVLVDVAVFFFGGAVIAGRLLS